MNKQFHLASIRENDIESLREFIRFTKANYPQLFVMKRKAGGFMLTLDKEGKKVKLEKDQPAPDGSKRIFCRKKEETCKRCGNGFESGEKHCGYCQINYAMKYRPGALPGIDFAREVATIEVDKPYFDQALFLVGTYSSMLRSWNSQDGRKMIAKVCEEVDRENGKIPPAELKKADKEKREARVKEKAEKKARKPGVKTNGKGFSWAGFSGMLGGFG